MITLQWLAALERYNRWMNKRLYDVAELLSDEERKRDCNAFFYSVHGTFNHILVADRIWLARFTGQHIPPPFFGPGGIRALDQELYADFDELRRERDKTDAALGQWLASLNEEDLAGPLVYMRGGQEQSSPLWWSVLHVFNHQTHHRGQVTTLLKQLGQDPGVTDLVAMLRSGE